MGTIVHRRIVDAKGGQDQGDLVVETEWLKPDGTALLETDAVRVSRRRRVPHDRSHHDPDGAWRAVVFKDNKERSSACVSRGVSSCRTTAERLTDESGRPTAKPVFDNTGVGGMYTSSEGLKGDDVWGKRARWMMLTGTVDKEPVTVAILDRPSNPNFPGFWHARGYGLFAINPLGEKVLPEGKKDFDLTLESGKSVTFHYRVAILDGTAKSDDIEKAYQSFASSVDRLRKARGREPWRGEDPALLFPPKDDLDCELHVPRQIVLSRHLAELALVGRCRVIEIRLVERVEELDVELRADVAGEAHLLDQRDVPRLEHRTPNSIDARREVPDVAPEPDPLIVALFGEIVDPVGLHRRVVEVEPAGIEHGHIRVVRVVHFQIRGIPVVVQVAESIGKPLWT